MSAPQNIQHFGPRYDEAVTPVERHNAQAVARFPLTARQRDLLRYIAGYQEAHDGISPSFEECSAALGTHGKGNVVRLMDALEERGHIRRMRFRFRAIEVLSPIAIPRLADGTPLHVVAIPALTKNTAELRPT